MLSELEEMQVGGLFIEIQWTTSKATAGLFGTGFFGQLLVGWSLLSNCQDVDMQVSTRLKGKRKNKAP